MQLWFRLTMSQARAPALPLIMQLWFDIMPGARLDNGSLGAQRNDRIQPAGPTGGRDAEEDSHRGRHGKGQRR